MMHDDNNDGQLKIHHYNNNILCGSLHRKFKEKFNVWLVNEGGSQIFFGSWIFLHLLVIGFGFLNYQLSDDLVDARAIFGITYCALFFIYNFSMILIFDPFSSSSYCLINSPCSLCRCHLYLVASLSQLHLFFTTKGE